MRRGERRAGGGGKGERKNGYGNDSGWYEEILVVFSSCLRGYIPTTTQIQYSGPEVNDELCICDEKAGKGWPLLLGREIIIIMAIIINKIRLPGELVRTVCVIKWLGEISYHSCFDLAANRTGIWDEGWQRQRYVSIMYGIVVVLHNCNALLLLIISTYVLILLLAPPKPSLAREHFANLDRKLKKVRRKDNNLPQ